MSRNGISDGPDGGGAQVTPLYPVPPHAAPQPMTGEAGVAPWMQQPWDMAGVARLLWRQKWLIAGVIALGLILAALLVSQWPRSYTAEAIVLLDPASKPAVQFDELLTGLSPDDQTLSSEILVLRSPETAAHVVRKLNLADNPDFNPALPQILPPFAVLSALPKGWLDDLGTQLGWAPPPPATAPEARLEQEAIRILDAFAKRLSVERMGRSHAISVSIVAHDPGVAADTANALVDRYLADQLKAKYQATEFAGQWLTSRVEELQQKVEAAERAVEEYRVASGLIDSNGVTVTGQQMAELNTQLIASRGETAAARARLSRVRQQLASRGDALSAAAVLSSPLIHSLKEQELEVLRRRADLAQEYGAKHPRMLSIRAELADIQSKIATEVHQIVAGLANAVAVAEAQEAALAQALRQTEASAADQSKAQVRLRALEREAEASRSLLQTFLQRTKQTSGQESIQQADARILARAVPPEKPSSPQRAVIFGVAGMAALMLGLALALLAGLRSKGVSVPAVLRQRLGVPVLGLIPAVRTRRRASPADEVLRAPLGSFAESVRMVAGGMGAAQVVLVTAAAPKEGKTSLALALARVLAGQGSRVLLVDADLRRSALSAYFGLERSPGLADALLRPDARPMPLATDKVAGLHVLPAGTRGSRVEGLTVTEEMLVPLLEDWRGGFDCVVVDAAPSLLISDVRSFARLADGVILAVRWRHTELAAVEEAAMHLREAGATILGTALTQVDLKRLGEDGLRFGDAGAYSAGLGQYYRERGRRAPAV